MFSYIPQRTDPERIKPDPPARRVSAADLSAKVIDVFVSLLLGVIFMCAGACAVLGVFEIAGLIASAF